MKQKYPALPRCEIHFTLKMSDNEIREVFKGTPSYAELCIRYRQTLQQDLISHCREDHVILVYIHSDFPQTVKDHAIVIKDSPPYNRLMETDDYQMIVDVNKYLDYLNHSQNENTPENV